MLRDIELKDAKLDLKEANLDPASDPSQEWKRSRKFAKDPFHLFFLAKLLFESAIDSGHEVPGILLTSWCKLSAHVGAFKQCIQIADVALSSEALRHSVEDRISLLLSKARSLRNLGDFPSSLECYRLALKTASDNGLEAEVSICLLLIGKLYGNYRGQKSLFSSFVEEARARLLFGLRQSPEVVASYRLFGYLAVCEDALGQAYRDTDSDRAESHFNEAIRINRKISRINGESRAICHLAQLKLKPPNSDCQRQTYLAEFESGLRLLQRDNFEERGLGVRWQQYARILKEFGRTGEAEYFLAKSSDIAIQYSDHKTLAKGSIIECEILFSGDYKKALLALSKGHAIARKYNLAIRECEINTRIAELLVANPVGDQDPPDLLERNRQILLELLDGSKAAIRMFNAGGDKNPEFSLISESTQADFREKLILDFEQTVQQLNNTVRTLVVSLKAAGIRRQELLIASVVNAVARDLAHDLGFALNEGQNWDPLAFTSGALQSVAQELLVLSADSAQVKPEKLTHLSRVIEDHAGRVEAIGSQMAEVRELLRKKLRRPRDLNSWTSLRRACELAVTDVGILYPPVRDFVTSRFSGDALVLSDEQLMASVVRQLIMNAVHWRNKSDEKRSRIYVEVLAEYLGDPTIGNVTQSAVLRVTTRFLEKQSASLALLSIKTGLEESNNEGSSGSGVGFDITRTVANIMRADIEVFETGLAVGTSIRFSVATGRTRILLGERSND